MTALAGHGVTTNLPVVYQEVEEQRRNYSWPDSRGAAVEAGQVAA